MLAGMTIAAVGCVVLAVAPWWWRPCCGERLPTLPAARTVAFTDFGAVVRLPGLPGSIAPGVIAAGTGRGGAGRGRAGAVAFAPAPGAGHPAAVGMRC